MLLVDSRDRNYETYPNPAKYRVQLPRVYRNVTAAQLLSAEIPGFYVFSSARHNVSLRVTLGAATHVVTIPDGTYAPAALVVALNASLADAFGSGVLVGSIVNETFRLTGSGAVSVDTNDALARGAEWGLGYYLGFDRNAVVTAANVLVAPNAVVTMVASHICIDIDELSAADETAYGGCVGKTFAKIPWSSTGAGYVFFDKCIVRNYVNVTRLDRLHVTLRHPGGELVDFQGMEHSLTLELEFDNAPLSDCDDDCENNLQ